MDADQIPDFVQPSYPREKTENLAEFFVFMSSAQICVCLFSKSHVSWEFFYDAVEA